VSKTVVSIDSTMLTETGKACMLNQKAAAPIPPTNQPTKEKYRLD
jgi:hypothetical protein